MECQIEINLEYLNNLILTKQYSLVSCHLRETFKLVRNHDGAPVQYEYSHTILEALMDLFERFLEDNPNSNDVLIELIRSFRTYVINPKVQNYLANNTDFFNKIKTLFNENNIGNGTLPSRLQKIILQFFINLTVSNNEGARNVYKMVSETLHLCLMEKIQIYEVSALLYHISLVQKLNLNLDLYSRIFTLHKCEDQNEYLHFLIESFISDDDFWIYYKNLDIEFRLFLLELIKEKLKIIEGLNLSDLAISTLLEVFIKSGPIIFGLSLASEQNLEPYEVSLLLQIITSLSSEDKYKQTLKSNKDLLINSGIMLINIHRLGKESENCFTSIQKLADLKKPKSEISEHPAFGVKADLIRLIGNLCWKNKIMQDLTREAELIPIILDCCNMDARNPFIIQCVILAVRNICEGNLDNQKVISGLHQQGTVSSTVLEELGVTLQSEGNKAPSVVYLNN